MGILRSVAGQLHIEITSADNAAMLQHLADFGIVIYDVLEQDTMTLQTTIHRKDYNNAETIVQKHGGKLKIVNTRGIFWRITSVKRHPILFLGAIVLLLWVLVLPSRVFFIQVEGNQAIPERLILEKAAECGIHFGASRRMIRSEKVKNALLSAIPELQWIGVNTSGCVATVSVREKTLLNEEEDATNAVSSIVASRDGVIVSATVIRGNLLCREGDAVQAGQTLVSGYTDCGITVQADRAEAEILAQTSRSLCSVTPLNRQKRGDKTETEVRYGLRIGKKLIKFYKDSGISDVSCVKMYSEEYLTLPGGFALPVAIVKETLHFYETEDARCENIQWLQVACQKYLLTQMAAGQILNEWTVTDTEADVCILTGKYACLEMIGQVKYEELMYGYGEEH